MKSEDATVLVLNSGSSSIKFKIFHGRDVFLAGRIEGIGTSPRMVAKAGSGNGEVERKLADDADHGAALEAAFTFLFAQFPNMRVDGVGHRVVHGGTAYAEPVLIDDGVLGDLERLCPLAPLHQPHNLAGIRAVRQTFPKVAQVACFDTAFHRKHPWVNDTFALPRSFFEEGVRRYGFHGLSYEFIVGKLAEIAPDIPDKRVIVAHLGNGASLCAIKERRSVGSTMGFSALDGLPMGTRCGQLDPGVVLYLMQARKMTAEEISDLLYQQSGLKGLSGISSDMRELEASSDPRAREAIDYFVFRIRREIGAMAAVLGGIDGLVFTGGIGENSAHIRALVCRDMDWLGIGMDDAANDENRMRISREGSAVKVLAVPTDEERMIARHTMKLLGLAGCE
ncbi:acetate kinase [Rhizobiales bacterium]|uniref:acetate/propionate family kinase n=1 Tax=Hongsoonwoonella zoysiae TaxID=2821844 RepID=UPI00156084A3|nr:acetate kinase [Hongsoonwoonella zoysiae]NRG16142.1 acetate kinase [Hongsoonwoonella zoysiae]